MCGIAGDLNFRGRATPRSLGPLRHRGPDGSGEWISPSGHCWLGHTRLAIIELSPSGAQPMADPATGSVIVFNGEIYNHLEIRRELEASGPVEWRGGSDTETLLKAHAAWGLGALPKLKGMFAYAVFNPREGSLVLARDPFGIKPLYMGLDSQGLRFSSEWRSLGPVPPKLSPADLSSYLAWGAMGEGTPNGEGVRALGPGCAMEVGPSGEARAIRYWPPQSIPRACPADPVSSARSRVETAVRGHLLADVPVAVCLSGGVDSSIITAIAARELGSSLKTFTVGFSSREFDEAAIAGEVARTFGSSHTLVRLAEGEVLPLVFEAVSKLDLPSVDAINTYIVSKTIAGRGVKVALTGLGSDELFGGYPSFASVPRLGWVTHLPGFAKRFLALAGRRGARLAQMPKSVVDQALWRRRFWFDADLARAGLPPLAAEPWFVPAVEDDFAAISWAEIRGYMARMLLRDADQMSMACSLELRVPFLDLDLAEFALGLPARVKTGHGRQKGLLIEAFKDLLPRQVYDRPKMGFALPMDEWMRGPLKGFVDDGLKRLAEAGCLECAFIDSVRARFGARRVHWTRFWGLVVLGHYLARPQS